MREGGRFTGEEEKPRELSRGDKGQAKRDDKKKKMKGNRNKIERTGYRIITMPRDAYDEVRIPPATQFFIPKKTELSKEHGFLIWFKNEKYPVKGIMLDPTLLMDVDAVKKFIKCILKMMTSFHPAREFFYTLSEMCSSRLAHQPGYGKPEYFDRATREIRRAGLAVFRNIPVHRAFFSQVNF